MTGISIDSLQLFIPIQRTAMINRTTNKTTKPTILIDAAIKDDRLKSQVISYYNATGEVKDIKDYQPFNHEDNGIVTGYRLLRKSVGPSTVTGLSIALSAKILSSDYLKGITSATIQQVYQELIRQDIIYIEYSDFLTAQIEMADIKRDTEHDNIREAFKELASRIKPSIDFKRHPNGNLTIGQRNRANNSNLYIKFYDKKKELESQSNVFYRHHTPNCPDNLLRTEITLHRKQLNEHFGPDYDNTLNSLMSVLDNRGRTVMATILNEYLNQEVRTPAAANENSQPNKLAVQVQKLVSLILQIPSYQRLQDVQDEVIEILQPGRDKRLIIKQLVSDYYSQYTDAETNLHPFIDQGGIIR